MKYIIIILSLFLFSSASADKRMENLTIVLQRVAAFHVIYKIVTGKIPRYTITSTIRNESHNKTVGGVPNSAHLNGKAVDIKYDAEFLKWLRYMQKVKPKTLTKYLEKIDLYIIDIGHSQKFIHYTIREPDSKRRMFAPWKGS